MDRSVNRVDQSSDLELTVFLNKLYVQINFGHPKLSGIDF